MDVELSARIMEQALGMRLEHRPASVGSFAVNMRSFETLRDFFASATITSVVDLPFAVLFIFVIASIGGRSSTARTSARANARVPSPDAAAPSGDRASSAASTASR